MDMSKVFVHCLVGVLSFSTINQIEGYEANSRHCASSQCGNLTIPFPFGVQGCNLSSEFLITCDNSSGQEQAFLTTSNIEVTKISLNGELEIMGSVAASCYEQSGIPDEVTNDQYGNQNWITLSKFKISKSRNKFTVVGCDSYAYLEGYRDEKFYSAGCMSTCSDRDFVDTTSCSGSGCCQIEIADGLEEENVTAYSFDNHTEVWNHSRCTFAFVAEENKFNFSREYLKKMPTELPVVLDWAIDNTTSEERSNKLSRVCRDHAFSYHPIHNKSRYLCKCENGYDGNPYLGCEDINECEDANLNDCISAKNCQNFGGNYTCSCGEGYHGDGRRMGQGCVANVGNATMGTRGESTPIKIIIGVLVGTSVLFMIMTCGLLGVQKKKTNQIKEKNFVENGGLLFQQLLSKTEGSANRAKIYTENELKKATNNFHESEIVGKGGYGTVYRGILDGKAVAIKKSKVMDPDQVDQFVNEVMVLSQIRHPNVVKLIGCCLETQVPLLVYEFITNKTLHHHIHNEGNRSSLPWEVRLNIAVQTADAIAHMHSDAPIHIIHRDIKSANILLDENFEAKVSDFGVSRLVPLDQTQLPTLVQGTFGYIDPEYFLSGLLNEKSDVYSFGVVLAELLTGKSVISSDRTEDKNLAALLLTSIKEDNLLAILDQRVKNEARPEQLKGFAEIAKCCLKIQGEKRPTMKEVKMELQALSIKMVSDFQIVADFEEVEPLLCPLNNICSTCIQIEPDSMKYQAALEIESGR